MVWREVSEAIFCFVFFLGLFASDDRGTLKIVQYGTLSLGFEALSSWFWFCFWGVECLT